MKFKKIKKKISIIKHDLVYKSGRIVDRLKYPKDLINFNENNAKFIRAYHPGLGDNLAYSTLPEEFKIQKNIKTYLLKSAKINNQEISDLVWGCNPFIEGRKEGPWNLGDHQKFEFKNIFNNMIMNVEYCSGLTPKNKYPKIYYKPKKIKGLEKAFGVDLNSNTVLYKKSKFKDIILGIKKNYPENEFLSIRFLQSIENENTLYDEKIFSNNLYIKNIFHYCDVIYSLYGYLSFCSGGSHLSSAIKGNSHPLESLCIIDEGIYNFQKNYGIYLFDNINYIVVKDCMEKCLR